MHKAFPAARIIGFILLAVVVAGCNPTSPYLIPRGDHDTESPSDIQVLVTPVFTTGIGSEQRGRFGVDLSAYFTAFEVKLINRSRNDLTFDPQSFMLVSGDEHQHPLDEEESLTYYRGGTTGGEKPLTLIEKPYGTIRQEMDRISLLRMKAGSVAPDQIAQGLIYFKKVPPRACRKLTLDIAGVAVEETGEEKNFRFEFACPAED